LRYAENLNGPEEMVQVCEPETGRGLSDEENELGSAEDLKNCQEGREEIPVFQVGNEMRSLRDLTDCQEDSQGISHCQLGNEMRSLRDLTDFQEGSERFPVFQVGKETEMESVDSMDYQESSGSTPYCQVGRDEKMSWNQPEELTEKMRLSVGLMNSEMSLDQHVQLTEEEDSCGFPSHVNEDDDKLKTCTIREDNLRSLMMIGGIGIFLSFAREEAEICVADAATVEEQSAVTVKEELEQVFETAQAEAEAGDEENEHSEEWLNAFSQEGERKEVVALKLTAKEAEEDDEHSEEWLSIFGQETEKTATWEFAAAEEEEADNICFVDLYEKIEALERRVKVQGVHIQQVKLEADEEESMGDHDDLPNCRKFLQLRRLQK
jgi:hypothetical protein